jgi:hypothetical protein
MRSASCVPITFIAFGTNVSAKSILVPPSIKLELIDSGNYGTDVVIGLEDQQAEREDWEVRVNAIE